MEQDLINMRKSLDNMKWALNGLINLQSRCGSDEKELKKKNQSRKSFQHNVKSF